MIYHKEGTLHRVLRPMVSRQVSAESNVQIAADRHEQTVACFCFVTTEMVAIADMSARIVVYDVGSRAPVYRLSGHERVGGDEDDQVEDRQNEKSRPRIRRMKPVNLTLSGEDEPSVYIVSADNRGRICVWNVHDCLSTIIAANQGTAVGINGMDAMESIEEEVEPASDLMDHQNDQMDQNGNNVE